MPQLRRALALHDQGLGYRTIGRIVDMTPALVAYYVRLHRDTRWPAGRPPDWLLLYRRRLIDELPTPRPDCPELPQSPS
jgi:hypothetical protein